MKRQWFYILFLFIFSAFFSCLDNPDMTTGIVNGKEKPTVVTINKDPLFEDGILLFQGEITSTGKSKMKKRGFYWSTTSNDPDENDSIITLPMDTIMSFTYKFNGASGDTTYYWRAFAENEFGCDFGRVYSYETPKIWMSQTELPVDIRGRGAVFTLSGNIYMTCGVKDVVGVFVEDTWEYNIKSSRWTQADSISFPGRNRDYPVVFTIGNFAYVGTGRQDVSVFFKDFYQFNANSRKWMPIATPDDFEARYFSTAFTLKGKGYVVGGYSYQNGVLNDVWQYNPDIGNWERKNDFPPLAKFYDGISISDNNRVFAGFGRGETWRTLWEYDSVTDNWDEFAHLPDGIRTKIYSGVIIKNIIYIVDGENQIWVLNMSDETKTWKFKTNLPSKFLNETGESGFQTLLTTGNSNSIYVGLGYSKLLYEYRPLWDN